MRKKLLLCVLFVVTYECDGQYGRGYARGTPILGGLLSGAQELGSKVQGVLQGIAQGGLSLQGHLNINQGQGSYNKPQIPNNARPEKPTETIIVVVEESPQQNQYGQGHYGQRPQQGGYGSRPGYGNNNFNKPNYNKPGYGDYGGNHNHNNNGPWDSGYHNHHNHRPQHHRPGYGNNNQGQYNNNGNSNTGNYNNGNNYGNPPNRPFDGPNNNNNNGNFNQNPPNNGNFNQNQPNNNPNNPPFDRPTNNNNFGNNPTAMPHRPFQNNDGNFNQGIPTVSPTQGELQNQNNDVTKRPETKPTYGSIYDPNQENSFDKKPVSSTTESIIKAEKTTKAPKDDDFPLFVPLNPNQYQYGGDKIEINAPKRETPNQKPDPSEDYSDSAIDPLDIRFGEQ